jgi:DNA polymerase III subunit delta'
VAIVDAADEMTPQAANALLKTLEEPPERAMLLLGLPPAGGAAADAALALPRPALPAATSVPVASTTRRDSGRSQAARSVARSTCSPATVPRSTAI